MKKLYSFPHWILVLGTLLFAGCTQAAKPDLTTASGATPATATAADSAVATAPTDRQNYYKKAFPQAAVFESKPIPTPLREPSDTTNISYVIAYDANRHIVGYLRDYSGPVSPAAECACNPLAITLVFDPAYKLLTILSNAPLQKLGHAPLTPAEQERMIHIAQEPPAELLQAQRVEDVVDATTGATHKTYQPFVIPQAGLSTRRIVQLTQNTQAILRGTPVTSDRERLEAILRDGTNARDVAKNLATFLPTIQDLELKSQAYRLMVRVYIDMLQQKTSTHQAKGNATDAADAHVEAQILNPKLQSTEGSNAAPADELDVEVLEACYQLADLNVRMPFVESCVKGLTAQSGGYTPPALARLRGTWLYQTGKYREAVKPLGDAVDGMQATPYGADAALRFRWLDALRRTKQHATACPHAKIFYSENPIYPGAKDLLRTCVKEQEGTPSQRKAVDTLVAALADQHKQQLLSTQQTDRSTHAPALSVISPQGQPTSLTLGQDKQATVVVFFATWCPHCQREMPRIVDFVKAIKQRAGLASRVRVIGIRTAVERETQPFDAFIKEYAPNFPIYTDATMSNAFAAFANAYHRTPGLPTIAIVDDKNVVRYFLTPGDHNDTQQELIWLVEDVL